MAVKRTIYYKMFAAEHLTDPAVDALSLEEQAVLVRMWDVACIEGELPDDPFAIARKARVDGLWVQNHPQSIPQILSTFFAKTEQGTWISIRMERERGQSSLISTVRQKAAKLRKRNTDGTFVDGSVGKTKSTKRAKKPSTKHPQSESESDSSKEDISPKGSSIPINPSEGSIPPAAPEQPKEKSLFKQIEDEVKAVWLLNNPEAKSCPYGGPAEGTQIKLLIKKTPGWPIQHYRRCLNYIFASEDFESSTTPLEIIPRLPRYFNGPRDRYDRTVKGKSSNGNGAPKTAQQGRNGRNLEALVLSSQGSGVQRADVPDGGALQSRTADRSSGSPPSGRDAKTAIADSEVLAREPT